MLKKEVFVKCKCVICDSRLVSNIIKIIEFNYVVTCHFIRWVLKFGQKPDNIKIVLENLLPH